MSSIYFISDVHLDPARPHVVRALKHFLHRLTQPSAACAALYILGDLFEAWVGDDDDSPLATSIIKALYALTASGPALFIMHGNRDFLLDRQFCAATGANRLEDPHRIDLFGRHTLLMHGDLLCTDDIEYQAFRTQVHQRDWREETLGKSLQQRRTLAAELRTLSHAAKSNKAEDILDVNPDEVDRVMGEWGAQILIHGHTHRPGCHRVMHGDRWVLGDWDSRPNALKVTSEEIRLIDIA